MTRELSINHHGKLTVGCPLMRLPLPLLHIFLVSITTKPHLQFEPEVPVPGAPANVTTLVTNDDTTKCIVVDSFEASWQQAAGVWQPKALFGTIAEEGSADDLFVWMVSYVSGHFIMDLPLKLSDPGKDLLSI